MLNHRAKSHPSTAQNHIISKVRYGLVTIFEKGNGFSSRVSDRNRCRSWSDRWIRAVREYTVKAPVRAGRDNCCFCKDDRWRLQKAITSSVLPLLGRLLSAPESKLAFPFVENCSRLLLASVLWMTTDFFFLLGFNYCYQLTWLNQHLIKIWPYVNEVTFMVFFNIQL